MQTPTIMMEVERVMNLISGFGWEKVREEIVEDEIQITVKKKSTAAATAGPTIGPS